MLNINHFVVKSTVDRVLLDQKGERMLRMYKRNVRYYRKQDRVEQIETLPEILPQSSLPAWVGRRDHIIVEGFIRAFGQMDYLLDRYQVTQVLIGQKYTPDKTIISSMTGIEGIGRTYGEASAYAVVAGELVAVSARKPEDPWKTLLIRTETDISQEGEKKVIQRNVIRCTYYDNAPFRPRISKFPVGSNIIVQLSIQTPVKDITGTREKRKFLDFYVEDIALVPGSEEEAPAAGPEKKDNPAGPADTSAEAGEKQDTGEDAPVPAEDSSSEEQQDAGEDTPVPAEDSGSEEQQDAGEDTPVPAEDSSSEES